VSLSSTESQTVMHPPQFNPSSTFGRAGASRNSLADTTELHQLHAALPRHAQLELRVLLSAPRHLRLVDPTPRFENAMIYLPAPRVWPDALMDDWVLENIDTHAIRIAVPSLTILLAVERATGTLHGHVFDLSPSALQTLRGLAERASGPQPMSGSADGHRLPASLISLSGDAAADAWAQLDITGHRHYASFDHRNAYDDPELRMRVAPSRVALFLPGVVIGRRDDGDGNADDSNVAAALAALCERPIASLLSPWLSLGLVGERDDALSLATLHACGWVEESANWLLARHAEIGTTGRDRGRVGAALASLHIARCAAPLAYLLDEEAPAWMGGSNAVVDLATQVGPVWAAMRTLSTAHPAWGGMPAFNWLTAQGNIAEQARRIDAALADPAGALVRFFNAMQSDGADRVVVDFLKTLRSDDESENMD
jgi:hypothetical protein